MGELFFGAERSKRREAKLAEAEAFAGDSEVRPCDLETARHYGVIENALRAEGRPIPDNDIWIAALAQQHELIVVTRDVRRASRAWRPTTRTSWRGGCFPSSGRR